MSKTPQELGQELLAYLAKGEWVANETGVKTFVDAGADLKQRDANGDLVLTLSAHHGLTKIAIGFIGNKNVDINAVNNRKESALMLSLYEPGGGSDRGDDEFLDIAKALLQRKDLNVNTATNESPLTKAAGRGLFQFTKEIAALGADLDFVDWTKETAMDKAKKNPNYKATVEVLEEAFANREKQRELDRQVQAAVQLRQNVDEITTIMRSGTSSDMVAPERAQFKRLQKKPI